MNYNNASHIHRVLYMDPQIQQYMTLITIIHQITDRVAAKLTKVYPGCMEYFGNIIILDYLVSYNNHRHKISRDFTKNRNRKV